MKKQFIRLMTLVAFFYSCDNNNVEDFVSVDYQTAIIGTWRHTHNIFIYQEHYDTVNVVTERNYEVFRLNGTCEEYKNEKKVYSGLYKIKDDSLIYMSSNGIPVREKHTIRKLDGDILQIQNISEYIDRDTLIYVYKKVVDFPF